MTADDPEFRRHAPLTRRAVLLGSAGAFALAACSSNPSGTASTTTRRLPSASLLAFFPPNDYITTGAPQRIAFGIADARGGLVSDSPSTLTFTVTGPDATAWTKEVLAHQRDLPWAYYPIEFTPTSAGEHTVTTTVNGEEVSAVFSVGANGSSPVPGPGDELPAMTTPTTQDPLGVDPLCTQDPPCPLHAVSLDKALEMTKPVAYLVATPKFCQTGVCGPVLEVLESTVATYGDKITFIHQEVFQSAEEAAEKGQMATLTEAVQQLQITSEPVLFIADRGGVIQYRLDNAYDADELGRAFDDVLA